MKVECWLWIYLRTNVHYYIHRPKWPFQDIIKWNQLLLPLPFFVIIMGNIYICLNHFWVKKMSGNPWTIGIFVPSVYCAHNKLAWIMNEQKSLHSPHQKNKGICQPSPLPPVLILCLYVFLHICLGVWGKNLRGSYMKGKTNY